jgi:histidine triad (HIT) family protein
MTPDCVFCKITRSYSPATIVQKWGDAVAIVPLNPVTFGHLLVIPLEHVIDALHKPDVTARIMEHACELATAPCNLITSVGEEATQTVKHLHIHIVPRAANDGLCLPWTGQ